MKKRKPPLVEIDSREVESIEDIAFGMHYRVKGGLKVESNLSELVEEMELNTKVQIIGKIWKYRLTNSYTRDSKGKG